MVSVVEHRLETGSAISEVGPALFILLMFAFFPIVDVIWLGVNYSCACTLNDLQLREAARLPKSQTLSTDGAVQLDIPSQWRSTALGRTVNPRQDVQTSISYQTRPGAIYVSVNTTVSFLPLLSIPFFSGLPGLGAPITFTVSGSRPLENPRCYFY